MKAAQVLFCKSPWIQLTGSAGFRGRSEYYECIACVSKVSAELDSSKMGIQALYETHTASFADLKHSLGTELIF